MSSLGIHRLFYNLGIASIAPIASISPIASKFTRSCFFAFAAALLSACASKPTVTPVTLTLTAAANANPDTRGRASPLTVRAYALKSAAAFEAADFFSLYEKDTATLGAELVQREEVVLRPGDSRTFDLTLPADAKAIAVMAAYRDLERARWREVRSLEAGSPTRMNAVFEAQQIQIQIQKK
jgi:type VI secretion system protein VasD